LSPAQLLVLKAETLDRDTKAQTQQLDTTMMAVTEGISKKDHLKKVIIQPIKIIITQKSMQVGRKVDGKKAISIHKTWSIHLKTLGREISAILILSQALGITCNRADMEVCKEQKASNMECPAMNTLKVNRSQVQAKMLGTLSLEFIENKIIKDSIWFEIRCRMHISKCMKEIHSMEVTLYHKEPLKTIKTMVVIHPTKLALVNQPTTPLIL
jgi:hypothetical protein